MFPLSRLFPFDGRPNLSSKHLPVSPLLCFLADVGVLPLSSFLGLNASSACQFGTALLAQFDTFVFSKKSSMTSCVGSELRLLVAALAECLGRVLLAGT